MARILAVEREGALLGLYRRILEGQGYEVIRARNAKDALLLLNRGSGRFVLVIVDVEMYHGRELIQEIKAEFPEVPILICSSNVGQGLRLAGQGVCVGYVPKPFDLNHLIEAVRAGCCMDLERRSGEDRRRNHMVGPAGSNPSPKGDRRSKERRVPLEAYLSMS